MRLTTAKTIVMTQQYFPEIRKKVSVLMGFVLVVVLGGVQDSLATSQEVKGTKPVWTTAGTHPSYPPPRYIQGVGLAKASKDSATDRQIADQNAFSEIIRQISAEVSSELAVEKMEVTGDKAETLLERTSSGAKIRSSVTLSGLTIVERHYDPQEKIYYSLGILDRVSASEPQLQVLENYRQDYERYSMSAMKYRQQGKVFQSLLSLRDAYQAACRYQEKLPSYQLMAGHVGEIELETPPSPAAILEKLTDTLSHLEFRVAKGDRQFFVHDKPLANPLVARLMLNNASPTPAEGFPVTFSFHTGQGTLLSQTGRTDSQGAATAVVSQVKHSNDREYTVAAEIEFHELLGNVNDGGAWNSKIPVDAKKVLFTFAPKKATGAIGVLILISDQNSGEGGILMRDELATHLSQAGFSPVADSESGNLRAGQFQQNLRGSSIENLRKQVPKNVGAVILAEISASTSNNAMGMIVCRINGLVKAYSAIDWQVIASESFQDVRGFGATEEQARNDAYKNAGLAIADPLIGDFLSRYEAP